MHVCAAIDHSGSTPEERLRRYPCDDVLPGHEQALFRAVTVDAPRRWCSGGCASSNLKALAEAIAAEVVEARP